MQLAFFLFHDHLRMQRLALLVREGGPHSVPGGASAPSLASAAGTTASQVPIQVQLLQPSFKMSGASGFGPVHMGRLQLCGQACRFSPFADDLFAAASSQLFGMAGPGALEVFSLPKGFPLLSSTNPTPHPGLSSADAQAQPGAVMQPKRVAALHHKEALNDVAWSELSAQTLVGGGGGGSVLAWRLTEPMAEAAVITPGRDRGGVFVAELKGHVRDIMGLSWSCVDKRFLVSAALDGQLRVWDMQQCAAQRVLLHSCNASSCTCSTSPVDAALIASVGADGRLAIHDLRNPSKAGRPSGPAWGVTAHPCEALCLDWMKHRPWQLITGAADGTVALWDLRRSNGGSGENGSTTGGDTAASCRVSSTQAHQLAVRRVASHPFNAQRFATCSYDMQVKIWDSDEGTSIELGATKKPEVHISGTASPFVRGSGWVRLQACFDHHREFAMGLDWSTFSCGRLVSTSWDRSVCVWNADSGPAPPLVPKRPLFLSMKTSS